MPASELERIIGSVSKVLPPLSQGDNVQLSVMLPLVATILENPSAKVSTNTKLMEDLESMASPLADFSLCQDWNADARSAASTCLFQTILHYQQDKTKCIGPAILKDCISPYLFSAVEEMEERSTEKKGELRGSTLLRSSLDLCAVVVSSCSFNRRYQARHLLYSMNQMDESSFHANFDFLVDFKKYNRDRLLLVEAEPLHQQQMLLLAF